MLEINQQEGSALVSTKTNNTSATDESETRVKKQGLKPAGFKTLSLINLFSVREFLTNKIPEIKAAQNNGA